MAFQLSLGAGQDVQSCSSSPRDYKLSHGRPGVNAKQSMLSGGCCIKNAVYHLSKTVSGAQ